MIRYNVVIHLSYNSLHQSAIPWPLSTLYWLRSLQEMPAFGCFWLFLVSFGLFSAQKGHFQVIIEIEPCQVERWLSPFCSYNNQYFSFKKYEENLKKNFDPPPFTSENTHFGPFLDN